MISYGRAVSNSATAHECPTCRARRLGTVERGPVTLCRQTRTVRVHGEPITLATGLFSILETLMRAPGLVPTDRLISALYAGAEEPENPIAVLRVNLCQLRKKLPARYIESIRGAGYVISPRYAA